MARALSSGPKAVTHNLLSGTLQVLKDQAPRIGTPDPTEPVAFFLNGALELSTGSLRPICPADRNTRTLSVNYDPAAIAPRFSAWVAEIFSNEPARIALAQEIFGWTFCRASLGLHKAVLLIGPQRAGKGVLLAILEALHGGAPGAAAFTLGELDNPKVLSSLARAHVGIDSDAVGPAPRNARAVLGLFKRITAGESVDIPQLYQQHALSAPIPTKLFFACNSAPTLWDDSAAAAHRFVPLVFDQSFIGREDPTLVQRLQGNSRALPRGRSKAGNALPRVADSSCRNLPSMNWPPWRLPTAAWLSLSIRY
ncbi:hypothetical protein [Microbulbifer taiwanensis]|uniref:hypothetical protein n=1 Tax=Microbulbifer taiwanensis TaxID=986746 RepID=UPI00361614DE